MVCHSLPLNTIGPFNDILVGLGGIVNGNLKYHLIQLNGIWIVFFVMGASKHIFIFTPKQSTVPQLYIYIDIIFTDQRLYYDQYKEDY